MAAKTTKQRRAARAASRRRRRRKNLITLVILLILAVVVVLLLVKGCHKILAKPESSSPSVSETETGESKKTLPDFTVSDVSDESAPASTKTNVSPVEASVEEADGITCVGGVPVVNKTYGVSESYVPADLVDIGDGKQLDSTCYDAFLEMAAYAYDDDVILWVASGYRDYAEQQGLYDSYAAADGVEAADRYSARPGSSEHHTGLAIDLNDVSDEFGETPEGKWVMEHCAEYGFILRYPVGKEEQTGYMYEPWHIRYVGKELAQAITDSGLCLEEYFGITSEYAE